MICKYCGKENNDNNRFCVNCGKELDRDSLLTCDVCGKDNPVGSIYCIKCGRLLTQPSDSSSPKITNKKLCPKCSYKNDEKNNFCINCGESLEGAYIMPEYEYERPQENDKPVLSPKKAAYKYYGYTVTTLVLTFALMLLPILGQIFTTVMSIIAIILAKKEIRENGSEPAKTALIMSIIALICSVIFFSLGVIAIVDFINIEPYIDSVINNDDETITMMRLFKYLI